jgi:hypothetical protein
VYEKVVRIYAFQFHSQAVFIALSFFPPKAFLFQADIYVCKSDIHANKHLKSLFTDGKNQLTLRCCYLRKKSFRELEASKAII